VTFQQQLMTLPPEVLMQWMIMYLTIVETTSLHESMWAMSGYARIADFCCWRLVTNTCIDAFTRAVDASQTGSTG
jgi:hypothetical protein